tara:strand:- start:23 stop:583 length:561 start_codon:yes stop_codon:yes gene_type:complete
MANGTLKVSNIETSSGSGTITLGQSGETVDFSNATTTLSSAMKSSPAFFSKGVSSSQAIGDQTFTTLTNWNTPSNLLGTVTFASGVVTLGTAGTYFFYAMPDMGNMADGDRAFVIIQASEDSFSSSTTISSSGKIMNANGNADVAPQVSCIHTCTTSTQIRVQVWQDYGGNRNFQSGTFMGYRLLG